MTVCLTCGEDPCGQHARCNPQVIGFDLSDGVEVHVEGFWKDGVLHITDQYEIVDHKNEARA